MSRTAPSRGGRGRRESPRARERRSGRGPPGWRRSSPKLRRSQRVAAGNVSEERGQIGPNVAGLTDGTHDRRARLGKCLHAGPRPRLWIGGAPRDGGASTGAARVLVEHRYEVPIDRVEAKTLALEVVEHDDGVPARSS